MTGISPNISIFIINTNSLILLLKERHADGNYAELSWKFTKKLKMTQNRMTGDKPKKCYQKGSKKCTINNTQK